MVKLRLVPYKLRVKNLDKSKKGSPVYDDLEDSDFRKYFQEFIKDHQSLDIDTTNEKIFNCDSCKHNINDDVFYGNLGCGDYGYSSEIINIKTFNVKSKDVDEAEKIKFYYLVKINKKEAYILLNQFKHRGIKTQFRKQLNKYINDKKGYKEKVLVDLNPLISSKLMRIKELGKIRLIRTRKRKDIEGQILDKINGVDGHEYVEEKIIRPQSGVFTSFKQIIATLRKNFQEKEYIEIDKARYEKIKLDVEMEDGSSKTITLNNDFQFNESIEQEFDGDFPTLDDFYKKTKPYFLQVMN